MTELRVGRATPRQGSASPGALQLAAAQAALRAMQEEHRAEVNKLKVQLALYRQALLDGGLEPPDKDGQELLMIWQDAATLVRASQTIAVRLGSAREMMEEFS